MLLTPRPRYRVGTRLHVVFALLAWVAVCWTPARQVYAAPVSPEIEYVFPEQSVWTTKLNDRGEPENPLLRLAAVLFGRAGLPWHAKAYPAARMFTHLQDGTAQFSILVDSQALWACCLRSKSPVAGTELRVYRVGDKPPILRGEDLAGKRIITIRGYTYGGLLDFIADRKNGVANNPTMKHETAFAMLDAGRADYLLDYTGPASEVLAEHPIDGLHSDTLSHLDVYLVLSKSYPDAEGVMARLEAIAATLNLAEIIALPH